MNANAFVDRVFQHLPKRDPSRFEFASWSHGGKPTNEGFGLLPISVDPDALIARVMDVDRYVGNVEHVSECRAVQGPGHSPPEAVRFYQRVSIPVLGDVHHELVLHDGGTRDGWRLAFWEMLEGPTTALSTRGAVRSEYNVGAWLAKPGFVGYALCSAPRKDDVGRLKFAAMTKGADAAAAKVVKSNIEGMVAWARRG
ncbi:MAG: hypothetical protein H6741_01155 [Alphaproteobacteria bacterium]|nr:hypothetical protein [Alphaproteobacteria bacterium]MCB9791307.1 hypothetical protein [Alphaproteobacteria bacterium]